MIKTINGCICSLILNFSISLSFAHDYYDQRESESSVKLILEQEVLKCKEKKAACYSNSIDPLKNDDIVTYYSLEDEININAIDEYKGFSFFY